VGYHRCVNDLPAGILIDLDDTILDDSGTVEGCWTDACAEAGLRIPGLDVEALRIEIRAQADGWWSDASRHESGRLDLRAASREIVREVFDRMGYDVALAADVANHYRDLREERARLLPGAIETLEWLRARGVRLGLMTNGGGPSQRAKIERFRLAGHFQHIVIEGEFGCGKPDRRVFESLLAALRVEASETWAVGDNIEVDVFGAMDVEIHGIWVDASGRGLPAGTTRRPDRVITSLSELVNGGSEHG
jgi:putative hydrolase of the HAD superfamily